MRRPRSMANRYALKTCRSSKAISSRWLTTKCRRWRSRLCKLKNTTVVRWTSSGRKTVIPASCLSFRRVLRRYARAGRWWNVIRCTRRGALSLKGALSATASARARLKSFMTSAKWTVSSRAMSWSPTWPTRIGNRSWKRRRRLSPTAAAVPATRRLLPVSWASRQLSGVATLPNAWKMMKRSPFPAPKATPATFTPTCWISAWKAQAWIPCRICRWKLWWTSVTPIVPSTLPVCQTKA